VNTVNAPSWSIRSWEIREWSNGWPVHKNDSAAWNCYYYCCKPPVVREFRNHSRPGETRRAVQLMGHKAGLTLR
jgi:hypothetical protein